MYSININATLKSVIDQAASYSFEDQLIESEWLTTEQESYNKLLNDYECEDYTGDYY